MNSLRPMVAQTIKWVCLCLLVMPQVVSAACVAEEGGIGGTGAPLAISALKNEGGIGGTGAQAKGGIGGTGIVGTITGFASVCINGLEVNYDDATRVSSNGQAAGIQKLAIGQVIAIDAMDAKNGMLAREIEILNAVEGPVTGLKVEGGLVEVMGQQVRLNDATRLDGIAAVQEITMGAPLKVSGYRNAANEISATRIERVSELAEVSLVGTVARDGAGGYVVSGTPVQAKESMLVSGSEVLVKGKWNGRQLIADSAQQDPSLHFAEHGRQVVVEGLVVERMPGEQMKISGFDIDYSNSTLVAGGSMEQLMQGHLVRVTGQVQAGRRLQANRIEIMRRPEIVSHMFGVMLGEKGRKHNAGMPQSMPTQMKHNRASHPDPLRRPMPTTGQNRPMPMMKH